MYFCLYLRMSFPDYNMWYVSISRSFYSYKIFVIGLFYYFQPVIQLRIVNIMVHLTAGNHDDWMRDAHIVSLHQQCDVMSDLHLPTTLPWWEHDCPTHPQSCEHTNILLLRCRYHMIQGEVSNPSTYIVQFCGIS